MKSFSKLDLKNFYNNDLFARNSLLKEKEMENNKMIHMTELYFHKDLQNLSGWKVVEPKDNDLPILLHFKIPEDMYKSLNSPISFQSLEKCIFLRCARISQNNDGKPFRDSYPLRMRMFINAINFTSLLPRKTFYSSGENKNRLSTPTVLNKAIYSLPGFYMQNRHVWMKLYFDRHANKGETFAFAVFSSTTKTVEDVCFDIILKQNSKINNFETHLKSFLSEREGITSKSIDIPFRLSVSLGKIVIPFRGRNCNHIDPDDLKSYIEQNNKVEVWECNICKSSCTPNDIIIDEFFTEILKRHPTVDRIEFYPNMRYKLLGLTEILSINEDNVLFQYFQDENHFEGTINNDKYGHREKEIIVLSDSSDDEQQYQNEISKEIDFEENLVNHQQFFAIENLLVNDEKKNGIQDCQISSGLSKSPDINNGKDCEITQNYDHDLLNNNWEKLYSRFQVMPFVDENRNVQNFINSLYQELTELNEYVNEVNKKYGFQ